MRKHGEYGGFPGSLLTFSLLLLVLAIGFVVGRVVARGYAKMAPKLEPVPVQEQGDTAGLAEQGETMPGPVYVPAPASPEPLAQAGRVQGGQEATAPEPHEQEILVEPSDRPLAGPLGRPAVSEPDQHPEHADSETPEEARYSVQAGVFALRGGAKQVAEELIRDGYPARIEVEIRDGQPVYRVLAGTFRSEREARAAQNALQARGFAGFLVRE